MMMENLGQEFLFGDTFQYQNQDIWTKQRGSSMFLSFVGFSQICARGEVNLHTLCSTRNAS